jgi:hypothetical protein
MCVSIYGALRLRIIRQLLAVPSIAKDDTHGSDNSADDERNATKPHGYEDCELGLGVNVILNHDL